MPGVRDVAVAVVAVRLDKSGLATQPWLAIVGVKDGFSGGVASVSVQSNTYPSSEGRLSVTIIFQVPFSGHPARPAKDCCGM